MKVLVTGADGFVGSWLLPRLLEGGHAVTGALRPGTALRGDAGDVPTLELELRDPASVEAALDAPYDAVVHLAAVSSGADARKDVGGAWEVNAGGTARLLEVLGAGARRPGGEDPLVLLVSTAEVYGAGSQQPRSEGDPVTPCSPYAASKVGAETAAMEVHRRTGLHVIIVRPFAHTGRGQDTRFAIPAFAQRLVTAKRIDAPVVKVGNLEPVREVLHVSDVVEAYVGLLEQRAPAGVYNVASGVGYSLADIFAQLAEIVGHRAVPEVAASLVRPADIPHLVGDAGKLRELTGWAPRVSLRETLAEVVDAQTH